MAVERALWAAARLLEDRSALLSELAVWAGDRGHGLSAEAFRRRSTEALEAGETIKRLLEEGLVPTAGLEDVEGLDERA